MFGRFENQLVSSSVHDAGQSFISVRSSVKVIIEHLFGLCWNVESYSPHFDDCSFKKFSTIRKMVENYAPKQLQLDLRKNTLKIFLKLMTEMLARALGDRVLEIAYVIEPCAVCWPVGKKMPTRAEVLQRFSCSKCVFGMMCASLSGLFSSPEGV